MENTLIESYCEAHTTPPSPVLQQLERETHLKTTAPQMLSGHLQGVFLTFISNMIRPKYILEIGTFTGYSAICLAQGLTENGVLHTIDIDEEKQLFIEDFIQKANLKDKIKLHIGNAAQIIPTLTETFDLVFIDADKENYAVYYDLVLPRVRLGGFILADNVLWKGKVLDEKKDKKTQIIHNFNQKIANDSRVQQLILPLRDGLMLIQKIK